MTEWEERMEENIEFVLKLNNNIHRIDRKIYHEYFRPSTKYSASNVARVIRNLGYSARVIKYLKGRSAEGMSHGYVVLVRRK